MRPAPRADAATAAAHHPAHDAAPPLPATTCATHHVADLLTCSTQRKFIVVPWGRAAPRERHGNQI
jgi:hypothetical protein